MWATERLHGGLVATLLAASATVRAEAGPVTEADIERARRSQPTVTEADVQRARERHRMPTDTELRQAPARSIPRIDALPQPAPRQPIDLEALARGFDATATAPPLTGKPGPTLLVFVSFSMPEATLSRLVDQAARAGASLVLRGLSDGSLVRTVSRVQQLIGPRHVAVQIDPQAFDRYAVTQTPSFVLVRSGAHAVPCTSGSCVPPDAFVIAAGDVSLDYALAFMQRSAPAFAPEAATLLKRLKASKG